MVVEQRRRVAMQTMMRRTIFALYLSLTAPHRGMKSTATPRMLLIAPMEAFERPVLRIHRTTNG